MTEIIAKNAGVWENIYSSGLSNLKYPNEMLVRVFNKYKAEKNVDTVLDFGFGAGANLIHFLESGCEVHGVEVSESAIRIVEDKLRGKKMHADLKLINDYKLPYEDNTFDLVVAWQVLAYNDIKSFNLTMGEISRVLKSGGVFIGTMTSIGDQTHKMSEKVAEYIFKSNVETQKGATCIIVDKEDISTFFPDKKLNIGEYLFDFEGSTSRHWIVVYEN